MYGNVPVGGFDVDGTDIGTSRAMDDVVGDSINGREIDWEVRFVDVIVDAVTRGVTQMLYATHLRRVSFRDKKGGVDTLE